jgi:ankyrin repeat protein
MHLAAARGFPRAVALLADAGADVDLPREEDGRTPLHIAANEGSAAVVGVLLSRGARPDPRDVGGWRPLHVASYFGSAAIADLLLRAGARADARTGGKGQQSPLHVAVEMSSGSAWPRREYDYPLLIRKLLVALEAQAPVVLGMHIPRARGASAGGGVGGPPPSSSASPGEVAGVLGGATPAQRARIREWVAERVDARDGYGRAALEVATQNLDTHAMALLLEHGASPGPRALSGAGAGGGGGGAATPSPLSTAAGVGSGRASSFQQRQRPRGCPPPADSAWSDAVAVACARRQAGGDDLLARGGSLTGGRRGGSALQRLSFALGSLMRGSVRAPRVSGGADEGGQGGGGLARPSRGPGGDVEAATAAAQGSGSNSSGGGGGGLASRGRRLSLGDGGGAWRAGWTRGFGARRSAGGVDGGGDGNGGEEGGDGAAAASAAAAAAGADGYGLSAAAAAGADGYGLSAAAALAVASDPSLHGGDGGGGGGEGADEAAGGGGGGGVCAGLGVGAGGAPPAPSSSSSSAPAPPLPLHVAVARGCTAACELLLEHGADIDAADASGRTPLLIAVEANSPAMIAWLLQRGAAARVVPPPPPPPYHHRSRGAAAAAGAAGAAGAGAPSLLGGGDDDPPPPPPPPPQQQQRQQKYQEGFHALHYAVRRALPSAALALLQHDPGCADAEDARGYSPLASAAERGDAAMCELLVGAGGADVGHADARRRITALHVAIYNGRDEAARWLLEKGADPNAADANGHAALHVAALLNRGALVGALLARGADVSLRDARGKTAEDLAAECGSEDVLRQFDVLHRL